MGIQCVDRSRLLKKTQVDPIGRETRAIPNLKSAQSELMVFRLYQTIFYDNLAYAFIDLIVVWLFIILYSFTVFSFTYFIKCPINLLIIKVRSKMGGQSSILNDPIKVTNIQNCFRNIDFSTSQKGNLSLQRLEKRKQTQVIKFKYQFINFDAAEDQNIKVENMKIEKMSQSLFESNISVQKKWSNYINQKSLIIENDHMNEDDEIKIRSIKISGDRNKKNFEFSENQITIKINIQSLENKQEDLSKSSSVKQSSNIIEQDSSDQRQSLKQTQQQSNIIQSHIQDILPLKTLAFTYKSYSTRNILRDIVHQLITKKGVRQFVIIGPQQIDKSLHHMRRTFISKILEVFYEVDQLIQIKKKKVKPVQRLQKGVQAKVLLIWQDLKKGKVEQQLVKIRSKMQIPLQKQIFS